jgi:hypothetical protein
VAGSFEHGSERSGSINAGKFLSSLAAISFPRRTPRSRFRVRACRKTADVATAVQFCSTSGNHVLVQ